MLYALLAHMTLLTIAVLRRDSGQGVAAGLLLMNWVACSLFVQCSGLDFPWVWYLTIDWLTAITLWIDRDTAWQRILIGSYALELLMHAGFAYLTQNVDASLWSRTDYRLYMTQLHYHDGLSVVEWAQMVILGSWIGYDAVRDWRRDRRGVSSAVSRNGKAAS